jgi:hypothetical protein
MTMEKIRVTGTAVKTVLAARTGLMAGKLECCKPCDVLTGKKECYDPSPIYDGSLKKKWNSYSCDKNQDLPACQFIGA